MSKLDELGGLEALKQMVASHACGYEISSLGGHLTVEWIYSLIERVEELEAQLKLVVAEAREGNEAAIRYGTERDLARKRVEQLELELGTLVPELQDANKAYGAKLQCVRELAETIGLIHQHYGFCPKFNWWDVVKLARKFLEGGAESQE